MSMFILPSVARNSWYRYKLSSLKIKDEPTKTEQEQQKKQTVRNKVSHREKYNLERMELIK